MPVPFSSMAADTASNRQRPAPGDERPVPRDEQPASAFDTTSLHEMLMLAGIDPNAQAEEKSASSGFPRSVLWQYIDQSRNFVQAQRGHAERLQAELAKQQEMLITERKTAALERALMRHERELVVAERSMWTDERLRLYQRVWALEQAELQRAQVSRNERPRPIPRPRPGQVGPEWTERFVESAYSIRSSPDAPIGPSLPRTVHRSSIQELNPPTSRPPTSRPPTQAAPIGPSPLRNVSRPNDQEPNVPTSHPMVRTAKQPRVVVEEVRDPGTRRSALPLDFIAEDFDPVRINPHALARNFLPDRPETERPEEKQEEGQEEGVREEGIRQRFLDPADARRLRYAGHTPPAGSVISSTDDDEGDEDGSEVAPKDPVPPALAVSDYEDDGDVPLRGQLSLPADDKTPRSEMFLAALDSKLDKASRTDAAPGASDASSVTSPEVPTSGEGKASPEPARGDTDSGASVGREGTGGDAAAAGGEKEDHSDTATTPKAKRVASSHDGNDGGQN